MRPRLLTEEQFAAHQARVKRIAGARRHGDTVYPVNIDSVGDPCGKPVHRPPSPYAPYKSKLECAFGNYLQGFHLIKEIDGWAYEPVRFKLPGERNYYKIDFSAWRGKAVTFYEVKGFNKSDARSLVKLKTAAGLNPWATFVLIKRVNGQWEEREIHG